MPRPNQKTVTLKKEVYEVAKKSAENSDPPKSVAGWITEVILEKTKGAA